MNSPIVVGTDLGASGDLAIRFASMLAIAEKAPLRVVHAGMPELIDTDAGLAEMRPYAIALREQLKSRETERIHALEAMKDKLSSIPNVSVARIEGRPWEAIVTDAAQQAARAIVVGPHCADDEGTKLSSRFVGTTASRVLHHAPCNVWVARGTVPSTLERCRIVVAIDFAPASIVATREAAQLARATSGTLILAHVLSLGSMVVTGTTATRTLLLEWSGKAEQVLQGLALEHCAGVPAEFAIAQGAPSTELGQIAHQRHATLMVVGTHGRTGIGRLFFGSVAEGCVRQAGVPVLVVRSGMGDASRAA